MLNFINNLDQTITSFLFNLFPHNKLFDTVFSFFSLYGFSLVIWFIIALLLIIFEEKRNKMFLIYLVTALITTFVFTNVILKNIFQRQRPFSTNQLVQSCPRDYSFPSGHATAAFTGAVILSAFDKKRRLYYFAIAIAIAYSRIYLGCHFFFDVVGGSIVGHFLSNFLLKFKKLSF